MKRSEDRFDELERDLSVALRRVDASTDFVRGVMLKVETGSGAVPVWGRMLGFPRRQAWIGSVAASLLVAGLLVGGVEHRRAETRVRAGRDFARSLEIADRAMEQTRECLQRAGVVVD